ncbi:hypothetical protein AVEN_87658-1 [Araneus ventricosus]|uniref:Uncharacterized protein n=1 Tax=Araneus ventricosus TaxID=182803 RepID=A0A4Y2QNY1_ARAVE|nr:hypothetical protein AVEN_87658-1 [Araneus ventricosus]
MRSSAGQNGLPFGFRSAQSLWRRRTDPSTHLHQSPKPQNGGKDCEGDDHRTVRCNEESCEGKVLLKLNGYTWKEVPTLLPEEDMIDLTSVPASVKLTPVRCVHWKQSKEAFLDECS